MALYDTSSLPLVSATKFDVAAVSVADETDYSGVIGAGSGDYVSFADMPNGAALLVCVSTGAAASSPTGLTVGLLKGTDANGSGAAFVAGSTTEVEASSVPGDKQYKVVIPLSYVTDAAGFYSAGVALKGGGSSSCLISTVTLVLNQTHL